MTKILVYGKGVNNVPGVSKTKEYKLWLNMLRRCYCEKTLEKYPTYKKALVSEEWLLLSNFLEWLNTQDYIGKQLDKDLLIPGNILYSKETCVFITRELNVFLTASEGIRGPFPIGVSKHGTKYQAKCSDPFLKKQVHLGYYTSQEEAHLAWKTYKHSLALKYAELETDPRTILALKTRYI